MDEDARTALRGAAQTAEWGTGDAEANADRLRALGRSMAAITAAANDADRSTWAYSAAKALADHCQNAAPTWSAEEVAKLARLREDAIIALAPGPGQADPAAGQATPSASSSQSSPQRRTLTDFLPSPTTTPRGRRAAAIGLAVVGCAALVGIALAATNSGNNGAAPAASHTTPSPPAAPTDTTGPAPTSTTPTTPASTTSPTGTSTTAPTAPSSPTNPTGPTTPAGTTQITAIQMTATPGSGYPEVLIYGTLTTSGTGDVTYTVIVAGASGAPQTSTEDESGQTSYALSQTIYLQPWCGQKSVTVTVSSGAVAKSATVPVSGC